MIYVGMIYVGGGLICAARGLVLQQELYFSRERLNFSREWQIYCWEVASQGFSKPAQ